MGMVGGGPGSFIGPVHRRAAELDGRIRLVAGAFSRSPEKSKVAGLSYGIAEDRAYANHRTMLAQEALRPDPIDLVAIVTPNDTHFVIARDAMQAGFDVISDKPATTTLDEALALEQVIRATGRLYALTYTYTGYPMLREARALIRSGALGEIRKVAVEYFQGWLAGPEELSGNKQAEWRADPARSGIGGSIADIGVHAFNLVEFVSGLRATRLHADLGNVVPGRLLDDDCTLLLRFDIGARGVLAVSQIATGERNGLRLRIWGDRGGVDWCHERPDILMLNRADGISEQRHAGWNGLSADARAGSRLPVGHPEGFIEALANIYGDFASAVHAGAAGDGPLQGIEEGVRGMALITRAVENSRAAQGWSMIGPAT
jgi:predicted dehydrogenase